MFRMTTRVYEIERLHMAVAEAPSTDRPARPKFGLFRAMSENLIGLSDTIQLWITRSRDRQFLGECSDHMLKDMGLSRCDADYEIGKGFWRG
jgi:uncharacterized protein YjiS (DUF1127 family)